MMRYVVGFLFNYDHSGVCLIKKSRPAWQASRLNGVGGHIERGETPIAAMAREFREETGASVQWRQFCRIYGSKYELFCFTARDSKARIRTVTNEHVSWYPVDKLPSNTLLNLSWLVPMAKYKYEITAEVHHESEVC